MTLSINAIPIAVDELESAPVEAPPAPSSEPTPEGKALASAALASAGHVLTPEDKAEVEKQLASYPSSNGDLRRFFVDNGVAPSISVTPPGPARSA